MAEQKSSGPTLNTRLAKAESLLLLALVMDTFVSPWLFSQVQIQPVWKTLLKMLLVVGCFGPLFKLFSALIDGSLAKTRTITTSAFSLPKMASHVMILSVLFVGFYWSMNKSLPWNDIHFPSERRAEVRR